MPIFRYFLGMISLCFCLQTIAADPFDSAQRQLTEPNLKAPKTARSTCVFNEPVLAAESAFEQLKLVGVVLYKQTPDALFLDMRQQLIVVKQGMRLAQEGYLLEQIRKDGVKLQRSKAGQCDQMESVELKF